MGIRKNKAFDTTKLATLTPAQFEAEYGIDQGTLANWRYRKEGPPFIKLGDARCSKILYRRQAVEQWLDDNQVRTK